MIDNCGLVSTDRLDADRYTSLQRLERALNQAIVQAEISESYEEYLEIFDAFYADDIVVAGDSLQDPIRGKSRVRALLANFLVPLHIMAEIAVCSYPSDKLRFLEISLWSPIPLGPLN
jgi:hypothetical protein